MHAVFVALRILELKAMAGHMSIRRYLKSIDGIPDPKGSLSTTIPSAAIASANIIRRIDISLNLVAILSVTVQRIDVGPHTQQAITLSSMLTARSLKARTIYGACIIIYRVKLFSFNFFIQKFLHKYFFTKIY